jgi:hypothetical protein
MTPKKLTVRCRLGRMLIGTAMVVPVLCTVAIAVTKHFLWVHYDMHGILLWLALDATVLVAGLVLCGESHS